MSPVDRKDPSYRLRHSTAHVMAQAVEEMFPEAKFGWGPPHDRFENGFYYDFDLPRALTPEDFPGDRGPDAPDRQAKTTPLSYRVVGADEARELFEDQPYKLETIDDLAGGEGRVRRGPGRRRRDLDVHPGRVRGSLSRTAPREHRPDPARRLQAAGRVRGVLAGERGEHDAPARPRHGLADGGGPGALSVAARGGGEARPPPPRRRARPVQHPGPRSGRDWLSSIQKGALVRTLMEDYWRERHRDGRLRLRLHAAHRAVDALGDQRAPEVVQRGHVRADRHRGRAVLPQADELPVPHADLQEPGAQLPRPADALRGARHRVPLRTLGHVARAAARARLHAGRRAPVLPAGPDAGRDRPRPRLLPVGPRRLRLRGAGDGAQRPRSTDAGEVRRAATPTGRWRSPRWRRPSTRAGYRTSVWRARPSSTARR